MSCEINYINNNYSEEEASVLADAHWAIVDKLKASEYLTKDLSVRDGSFDEAHTLMESINKVYRPYVGSEWEVVTLTNHKLDVDVRPIVPFLLAQAGIERPQPIRTEEITTLNFGTTNADPLTSQDDESSATTESVNTVFSDIISKLKESLTVYKRIVRDNPQQGTYAKRIDLLENVLANEDELKAISGFISLSANQLESARKKFESMKERYKDVSKLTAGEIKDFSTQLIEMQNFINFYKNLKEIQGLMEKTGVNFQWEIKARISEVLVNELGLDVPEAVQQALDILDITDPASERALMNALYDTGNFELVKKVAQRIKSTTSEDWRSADQSLVVGIKAIDDMVREFDTYYTDITAEWLFPQTEVVNQGLEDMAKGYDEKAAKLRETAALEADASVRGRRHPLLLPSQ